MAPSNTHPPALARSISNAEIAQGLSVLAQLLSAQGENPFKIRAYRRAAETVQSLPESVFDLVQSDADLTTYPGIGPGLAGAIRELATTGSLRALERLRATIGPDAAALTEYPRLDPKRVKQIYAGLGITSIAELRDKLQAGEIRARFGPRLEHHVRQALLTQTEFLLFNVDPVATAVCDYLVERAGARRAETAGDHRRRVATLRDLHVLVLTSDWDHMLEALRHYGGGSTLLRDEPHVATVRLPMGLPLTVEKAEAASWGTSLLLATGSEAHLSALEDAGHDLAGLKKQGASKPGRQRGRSKRPRQVSLRTEQQVYRSLGLAYIPPELREGRDEVVLATARTVPVLVEARDIRGDLHVHTRASDGAHGLEQMAEAARERGYEYLGITDHSQSLRIARGLSEADLWEQIRNIDRLNERIGPFRILKSAEVDILMDGRLDYPDALLRELDYTVCSIHSRFGLGRDQQTERLLRAMDNPYFTILGHATGRLLLRREGYGLDFERLVRQARACGCFFEINSSPDRLDLGPEHARLARDAGVKIAVCTDAHSTGELDFLRCGIDVARRAGLRSADVLNCRRATQLLRTLSARR